MTRLGKQKARVSFLTRAYSVTYANGSNYCSRIIIQLNSNICISLFKWIIIHLNSEMQKWKCMHWDKENKPGGGNDVEDDGNGVSSQWCWWRWRGSRRWIMVVMMVAGSVCCSFSSSSLCRGTSLCFFPSSFASVWFFSFWSLVFPSVSCSLFSLASSSGFLSEMLGLQWSRSLKLWNCYWRRSRGRAFCFSLLFVPPLLDSPLLFSPILPLFLLCFLCFFSFFFMHSSPSVFFFFLPPRLLLSSGFYSQRMQTFSGNRVTVAVHGGVRHAPWLKRLHYRC